MPGATDLADMLDSLDVSRRPGLYTFVTVEAGAPALGDGVAALIEEREGTTVVASIDRAERESWPVDFRATWLTLTVHSSLEAVGLTAAVAAALASAGIACNVVAGFHHDHLLVPAELADQAIAVLEGLRDPRNR